MSDQPESAWNIDYEPAPRKRVRLNLKNLANGTWQKDGSIEIESSGTNQEIEADLADLLQRVERQTADAIARREGAS